MTAVAQWYRKYETPLLLVLLLFAGLVLCVQITSTLIDYDEATYAKVVVDTIKSGDVSTFTLSGHLWFEKPPLYLWLAIGSVNLFGAHELLFACRRSTSSTSGSSSSGQVFTSHR